MKSRTLRWAALSTGLMFAGLGIGACGPLGIIAAGLVGITLLGGNVLP
jgi:hypothetical protein